MLSAAWGYLCTKRVDLYNTKKHDSKNLAKKYSYKIQCRGLSFCCCCSFCVCFFFFNRFLDSESGFLADSSLKGQTSNKKNSCFVQKGFLYQGSLCFLLKGIYFYFHIFKHVRFLSLESKQWVTQSTAPSVTSLDKVCGLGQSKQSPSLWKEGTHRKHSSCLWSWDEQMLRDLSLVQPPHSLSSHGVFRGTGTFTIF